MNKIEAVVVAGKIAATAAEAGVRLAEEYIAAKGLPSAVIHVGEQVAVLGVNAGKTVGELVKYVPIDGGKTAALVKLPEGVAMAVKTPVGGLEALTPKLFRDKAGSVYRTTEAFTDGELPHVSELRFVPDMVAPEQSAIKAANTGGAAIQSDIKGVDASGQSIKSSVGDKQQFLGALSEAPQLRFAGSPLFESPPKTIFNPRGASTNCMGCTAAVVRTMHNGELVTASQIEKLTGPMGTLGPPSPGRFRGLTEALEWYQHASATSITRIADGLANIAPDRPHAVSLMLKGADGEQRHMAFAFRVQNSKPFVYDPQSGVRWQPESVHQSKLPMTFYELKPTIKPLYK